MSGYIKKAALGLTSPSDIAKGRFFDFVKNATSVWGFTSHYVKDEGIAFFEYSYEEEKMGEVPPSNVYELAEELEYLGYEVNVKRVI